MNILETRKNEIRKRDAELSGRKACPVCGGNLDSFWICQECSFHEKLPVLERIKTLRKAGIKFKELFKELDIDYSAQFGYEDKIARDKERTGLSESVIIGRCTTDEAAFIIILMEQAFMAGTLSKASGEKIARAFEYATKHKYAVVAFCAGGGVRIQEGTSGLVQMAKINAALAAHKSKKLPYISILTNPTYGGTTASFALEGDINIAEPNSSIGFGGKMLVKDILHEQVPDNFQTEQFLLNNGSIDEICKRQDLPKTILKYLSLAEQNAPIKNPANKPVFSHTKQDPNKILSDIRSNSKPVGSDYLFELFEDSFLIKGDRVSGDDDSLLCGIGKTAGTNVAFIIQDKGRNLNENIRNNFGMTKPEGYRKAMRIASLAEKYNLPILILLDSPGAHPGTKAEEKCQSIAISDCITHLLNIQVPIISIITGEACSGGALALSISNYLAMFSESMYSVISPESYSAIISRKAKVQPDLLDGMKYTARDLYNNGLIDEILKEGDLHYNAEQIKRYLTQSLAALNKLNQKQLAARRYNRIRHWDQND